MQLVLILSPMSPTCLEGVLPRLHVRKLHVQISEGRADLLTVCIGVVQCLRDDH